MAEKITFESERLRETIREKQRQREQVSVRELSPVSGEEVTTAEPDTPVIELGQIMAEAEINSVVVEKRGRPIGLVTDYGLASEVVGEGRDPREVTAEEVMEDDPFIADAEAGVIETLDRMRFEAVIEERYKPQVILEDEDGVAGIFGADRFGVYLATKHASLAEIFEVDP